MLPNRLKKGDTIGVKAKLDAGKQKIVILENCVK